MDSDMKTGDSKWSPFLFGMITRKYPTPLWGHLFPPIGFIDFSILKYVYPIFKVFVGVEFPLYD